MQVTVINDNNIIVEVDQGKQGRGITNISYQQDGGYYYLIVTYTDGTTEQLGPLVITGAAVALLGGTAGAIAYQTAPDNTGFVALGTQNQVLVAGATAPQYTSSLTGLTVNNSAIGNTAPSTGAFTNFSASGTFSLTGDQVQISEGGTGQTTANAAFNALAPSQTGNSGKYLKTDGTNTSWDQLDISTADITGTLAVTNGGTGASTALGARAALGAAASGANNDITSLSGLTTPLSIVQGGTGANTAGTALSNLGGIGSITSSDGSIVVIPSGTSVNLAVSEASPASSLLTQVRNTTGATLAKGTVVYISGATGQIATVSKAIATSDATSAQTLGMITTDLPNNTNGYVTVFGLITNINTSAYTDGAQLYLSGTTAGAVTATKPSAPIHLVYVAVVEYAHPTQGKLLVKVQNGYELDELHDVAISSPVTGQTIVYNSSTHLWNNSTVSLTAGVSGTLPIANGGTNATATPTAGGVTYGSGTAYAFTSAGTSGQVLTSSGSSAPAWANPSALSRVVAIADGTSVTINADTTDIATQANTQAVGTLTIDAPTGTPVNGQKLIFRLQSTNVQTFSWNAAFQGSTDLGLPTASSGSSKYDYIGFMYNSNASKWQMIAKVFGF